jgi:multisubunit Na+/H+ antiporter MnhB subunit
MKVVILILLLLIVVSLGKALASLTANGGPERARAVVRALTFRISLSVGLFVLLLAGSHFGWITPHFIHASAGGS